MGSRYGRNKRRADRERIAILEREASGLSQQLLLTQRMVSTAKEEGARAVLDAKYLDMAVDRITAELSRAWEPELAAAAKRLIESGYGRERRQPIVLRMRFDDPAQYTARVNTVEGRIPELRYCVRFTDLWG